MPYARTALLLAALTGLFLVVGYVIGGQGGMIIALGFAIATNAFAYWNADKMVLRMYNAREVDRATAPQFYGLVEDLARRAGMPMPRVYIIDTPQPNAFATGRNPENAAVAATTGLLNLMSREEVAGVMAHELAHVRNHDTLIMTITAALAGAIGMIANFGFLFMATGRNQEGSGSPFGIIGVILAMIMAPVAAMLVQMAISRSREYEADRGGAEISGQPLWLVSALERLEEAAHRIPNRAAERNPATAHLYIVNPLHGKSFESLFSTHPSVQDRVRRLREMGGVNRTSRGSVPSSVSSPWA